MILRTKKYIIPVAPIPWQRAKINGKHFFDGQQKDKVCFGLYLNQQHCGEPLFDKPMDMDITFFMALPKSIKDRTVSSHHFVKPDLDNLLKFILDSFKDVIITDDKLICSLTAKKVYSKEPRTVFTLKELGE